MKNSSSSITSQQLKIDIYKLLMSKHYQEAINGFIIHHSILDQETKNHFLSSILENCTHDLHFLGVKYALAFGAEFKKEKGKINKFSILDQAITSKSLIIMWAIDEGNTQTLTFLLENNAVISQDVLEGIIEYGSLDVLNIFSYKLTHEHIFILYQHMSIQQKDEYNKQFISAINSLYLKSTLEQQLPHTSLINKKTKI